MSQMDFSIKLGIKPDLDVTALAKQINVVISEMQSKFGALGKSIQLLDANKIEVEANKIKSKFENISKSTNQTKKDTDSFAESISGAGNKATLLGKSFQFNQITQSITAAASALNAFTQPFVELDKQVKNIGTLGVKNFEEFSGLAVEMSKTVPDSAANIAGAAYQAISAGIQGTNQEIADFVSQAAKVGVAGLASTEDAVNGLTSVMNAYGLKASEVGGVSDTFFAAIKLGKTSFAELNGALANVIPAASAAGVGFDEVAANIAQMTALGVPTAQASTQIRSALIELQKPSATLAKAMSDAGLSASTMTQTLKEQGLTATLQQLQVSAAKSGLSLTQIFGSAESASAGLLLTGENAERAIDTLEGVRLEIERGVSTEAYNVAADSIDVKTKLISNQISATMSGIFDTLGSSAVTAINAVNQVAPSLAGLGGLATILPKDSAKNVTSYAKSLLGLIPPLFATNASTVTTATGFTAMWGAALGPITIVLASLAAVWGALYLLDDALTETTEEKLESAKADEEMIAGQKKVNEAEQNSLKSKQDLIDKYKELSSKSELTAFEQQKLKDTITQLNEIYPDAINSTKSFEENLKSLNQASAEDTQRLSELAEQMKKLDEDSKVATIKRVELEVEASAEDLKESVLDEVNGFFTTSKDMFKNNNAVNEYVDAIKNAANPEEANRALLAFNTALYNNPLFKDIPPDVRKSISEKAKGVVDATTQEMEVKAKQANEKLAATINDLAKSGLVDFDNLSSEQKVKIEAELDGTGKTIEDVKSMLSTAGNTIRDAKLGEIISKSTEINGNLGATENLQDLVKSYNEAGDEVEKSKLAEKIKNLAPEAVKATGTIADANGNLVNTYEVMGDKVEEAGKKQSALYSSELQSNQAQYLKSIEKEGVKYAENDSKMQELKAEISKKTELGIDTTESVKQYNKLKEENKSIYSDISGMASQWKNAGLSTEEVFKKIAESTGLPIEKVKSMSDEIDKSTKALENADSAVKSLGDSFSEALSTVKNDYSKEMTQFAATYKELNKAKASGDKSKIAEAQKEYDLQKKIAQEKRSELKGYEDATKYTTDLIEGTKKKGKTAYEIAQAEFKAMESKINLEKDLFAIEQEHNIAVLERQKTTEDDLILSQKKLESLKKIKESLIEQLRITENGDGVLSFGMKLKTEEKTEITNQLSKLNQEISKEETGKIKLNTTLNIQEEELKSKIEEQERKQLEYNVDIGLIPRIDLAKALDKDLSDVAANIKTKEIKIDVLKTSSNLSEEQKIELKKLEAELIGLKDKEITIEKSKTTNLKTIYDEELTLIQNKHSKELNEVEDRIEQEKRLRETLISSTTDYATSNEEAEHQKKLNHIEDLKEAEMISEGKYNQRKEELELEHQHRLQVIQEMSLGSQLEAQRQADLEKLNQKKAQLVEELEIEKKRAENSKDKKRLLELNESIAGIEGQIAEKGDIITTLAGNLQGNITEIFSSLTGNEEQMKEPWRKAFSIIAGALKELASTAITNLILGQLNITAGATGLTGLLLIPAIKGLANAGVNALLSPILSGLLSFSTGGRVDEPTLAWVGDASNSRPGADTEWIFRDDQIRLIMKQVVNEYKNELLDVFTNKENINIKELSKEILNSYIYMFNRKENESEVSNINSLLIEKLLENDVNIVKLYSDVANETKIIQKELKFNTITQAKYSEEYKKVFSSNVLNEISTDRFVENMAYVKNELLSMKVLFKENQFTVENINDFVKNYTKITTAQKHYMNDEIVEREYRETIHQSVVNVKSYANGSLFLDTPELAIIGDAGINNPEIVLNLDQMQEIMNTSADRAIKGINSKLEEMRGDIKAVEVAVIGSRLSDDAISDSVGRLSEKQNRVYRNRTN